MATYDFTLSFALPDAGADPGAFADALFEAGCDDATLGVGKPGAIGLDFTREAASADDAMRSAIEAVQRAIPGARLAEAKPDLVNLSNVAELVGVSRQNIRKYAAGEIRTARKPFPVPSVSCAPALWHFYEVAIWMYEFTDLRPAREIVEASGVAYRINVDTQLERFRLLAPRLAVNASSRPDTPPAPY